MGTNSADSDVSHQLLEEARTGDRHAIELLLSRTEPSLRRFVSARLDPQLHARVDPSDVVQDAQLEATRRLGEFLKQPAMPFRLWLRQLAQDRLLMLWRHHAKAARRSVQREAADLSSGLLARQLLTSGSTPSQLASQQELAERVRQAVDGLAAADREILLMRTFESLSFAEIAYLLNIDEAAARKRHGRALLRLHAQLAEHGVTESQI